jgi:hypothetical protein
LALGLTRRFPAARENSGKSFSGLIQRLISREKARLRGRPEDRMSNQSAANPSPRRTVAQLLLRLPDEMQIGQTLAQI